MTHRTPTYVFGTKKQRRDRRIKASVLHAQNYFFTHAPSITPSTSKKDCKYRCVHGLRGGVVSFQPIDSQAKRKNCWNGADDVMRARPTGSHGTGNEDHRENEATGKPLRSFAR